MAANTDFVIAKLDATANDVEHHIDLKVGEKEKKEKEEKEEEKKRKRRKKRKREKEKK